MAPSFLYIGMGREIASRMREDGGQMTEKADYPLDMAVFCHQSSVLQSLISGELWMTKRYSV